MNWKDKMKDFGKKTLSFFKVSSSKALSWFKADLLPKLKELFQGTVGQVYYENKEAIDGLVMAIATGQIRPAEGQSKSDLFVEELKKILDRNKDGHLTSADIPDYVLNFIREMAYVTFKQSQENKSE